MGASLKWASVMSDLAKPLSEHTVIFVEAIFAAGFLLETCDNYTSDFQTSQWHRKQTVRVAHPIPQIEPAEGFY